MLLLLAAGLVLLWTTAHASAVDFFWDGNGGSAGTGGNGTWDTASLLWRSPLVTDPLIAWPSSGTNNDAIFGGTAGTVSIAAGGVTANDLTFSTTGYTLQSNTLSLNGTTPTISVVSGGTATINANINSGSLSKAGDGTLVLGAVNGYTGATVINAGTLQVNADGAISASSPVTVKNGATLRVTSVRGINTGGTLTVEDGGTVFINNNAANVRLDLATVNMTGGSITGAANATLFSGLAGITASGLTINVFANATPSTIDTIRLQANPNSSGSGKLEFNTASGAQLNVSSQIANGGNGVATAVTKSGTGTLTLSGASTYTGATQVTGGILNLQNDTAAGTTAGGITVSNGTTLQLQGNITVGAETLSLNGTGAAGQNGALVNVSGTNNYGGLITLTGSSTISVDSDSLSLTNTGNITGSGFGLTLTGPGDGTLAGSIRTGAGGLTKNGAGEWRLTNGAGHTYTGDTVINNGTLTLANPGTNGNLNPSSAITINSGGTLQIEAPRPFTNAGPGTSLTINNGGTLFITNTPATSRFEVNTIDMTGGLIDGTFDSNAFWGVFTSTVNIHANGTPSIIAVERFSGPLSGGTVTFNVDNGAQGIISGAITNPQSGAAAVTKTGLGTLTYSGGVANSYTNLTTVSAGTLELSKTSGVNAIAGNGNNASVDLLIDGGTVRWLADHQLGNFVTINMTSGTLDLNGRTETGIQSFTNSGGTFVTGVGGVFDGDGASITWSGGSNTINSAGTVMDPHWTISGGTNVVQADATGTLQVETGGVGSGLYFTGTASPTITLNSGSVSAGRILLQNNVFSSVTAGTVQILSGGALANPGFIDMDGAARTFDIANGSGTPDMLISARLQNGSLVKTGAGQLQLTGDNTYTGSTTVNAGTLELAGSGTLQNASVSVVAGTFLQSSGTNNVTGGVGIGNMNVASGAAYTLSGGTLNFGDTNVGTQQLGVGTGNGASTLSVAAGGAFNFNDGTLINVTNINPNGAFVQNGGTLVVGVNGVNINDPLTTRAMTTIAGDYTLAAAGTLQLDIFGPSIRYSGGESLVDLLGGVDPTSLVTFTDSDLLWVQGAAELDGTLSVNVNGANATPFGWYDVIVANSFDIGPTFEVAGVSSYRIIDDPSMPGRQLLQVAVPEPASFLLWTGVSAALIGFVVASRRRLSRTT